MFGIDDWIAGIGSGHPLLFATLIAALLGLRHATDPDHLAAVTTLLASQQDRRARVAGRLGLAWGAGHATTLFLFGTPIVLAAHYLPQRVQTAAEAAVGVLIIALATRLLVRWRRGLTIGDTGHQHARPRTRLTSYGIGLLHGVGGSAGVGVLLLASISDRSLALTALVVFASLTAVSMAVCTAGFGLVLSRPAVGRRIGRVTPAIGVSSMAFGVWYVAAALALAPYPF